MAKLFPFKRTQPEVSREPRLIDIDDDIADDVFAALSSDTARAILLRLYEEPATASDVAEAVDTSLQNARYHLDKLGAAGLVEAVDTWYSSRGTEMTVYAPTNEPLVVAAGREESKSVLREALTRVLGAVAILAIASAVVDRLARMFGVTPAAWQGDRVSLQREKVADSQVAVTGGDQAANATATATPTPEGTATATEAAGTVTRTAAKIQEAAPRAQTETAMAMSGGGPLDALGSLIPPGALFFAGGLLVILLVAGWWYWSRYRPLYG